MPTLPTISEVTAETDIKSAFASFEAEQETYKESVGKYEQKKPVVDGKTILEVHEYVCPDKSVGWQASVTAEIDGKMMCQSFGVGKEAKDRSFGWTEIKDKPE